jgi:glutamyl-tRNA synthetase
MTEIRVRFAPSPTGPLHIGGVRTALYNYLFAKKNNGKFILRIEDTDQSRFVANAEEYIQDSLRWAGISPDEGPNHNELYGPYRQSERSVIYKQHIQELIDSGKAYYAFDSSEELNILREDCEKNKTVFAYSHENRDGLDNSISKGLEYALQRIDQGDNYVIRFKINPDINLTLQDEIRGEISINTSVLDDKILFKSDGLPTYHFANIVDDHLMKISHVIRGEEWLPSLALHYLLYDAFDWDKPVFAHLPLILKPVGKGKLSKRDGDKLGFPVFPLNYVNPQDGSVSSGYKESGYLPDAFINMLALLGWNPGTEQELFDLDQLVQSFSLDRVSKSGAKFSPEKTIWFNHEYLKNKTYKELRSYYVSYLQNNNVDEDFQKNEQVVNLIKDRANFPKDLWDLSKYFYLAPTEFETKAVKKQWKDNTGQILTDIKQVLDNLDLWTADQIQKAIKDHIEAYALKFGQVMPPLRLAQVGSLSGPDLFTILEILGKEEVNRRITYAVNSL